MENLETRTMRGTVIFKKANVGSKSESFAPYLYCGRGVPMQRLLMKDDNPFENSGFDAYDGLPVELTGKILPSGTFLVETIALVVSTDVRTDEEPAEQP